MFRGEYGICTTCKEVAEELGVNPQKKWIVIKKPYLCKYHNDMRKAGETVKIKPVTKSSIKPKFRKATGEWDMFLEIWKERKHICENRRTQLGDTPKPYMFSHIISKGRNPSLRLDPDNIELLCKPCHTLHETGTIQQVKRMAHSQKKKDYLKKNDYLRYCKLFGDDKDN